MTDGEVAFFALLASDMLDLAEKYKRDVDDVHRLFFEVSCDREKLVKLLEGKQSMQKWRMGYRGNDVQDSQNWLGSLGSQLKPAKWFLHLENIMKVEIK